MNDIRTAEPQTPPEPAASPTDESRRSGSPRTEGRAERLDVPQISLRALRKSFGAVIAVDGIDLDVLDGEFFAMLGPSGSGKTTVLRLIAGFETPTSGSVFLGGIDATALPPYRRDVNTVFQDYALFPHMTVAKNIGYGLLVDGMPKAERTRRVGEALEMVRLGGYDHRMPTELSGGQRQRVALARALVKRPKVLLLDEPLGALDLKLREQMQLELKAIQREVGITFVFVTHDQDEALTLCDRLAVFNNGRIEQLGPAQEVYEHPASAFVAGFVGSSNFIAAPLARALFGLTGSFAVRPEKVEITPKGAQGPAGSRHIDGVVRDVVYAGSITRVVVDGPTGLTLSATVLNAAGGLDAGIRRGAEVTLQWPEAAFRRISD
ncbi:MAG TPA: ABC transporter ATP-binding protein [Terrimesophilobacter sp.]|jgi:spermidine/putrescine ABC transporter ATP-binding subunit|uniref:ABC transporter ATP-binding protein n=1 Tax=Terrimesophilobacter sp. TaxID=2906435 RepID=UPI002F93D873